MIVSSGERAHVDADALIGAAPTAVLAAVLELTADGRLDRAGRLAMERLATASEWRAEFATIDLFLDLARTRALLLNGQIIEAQDHADAAFDAAVIEGAEFPRAIWSLARGIAFVVRGLPATRFPRSVRPPVTSRTRSVAFVVRPTRTSRWPARSRATSPKPSTTNTPHGARTPASTACSGSTSRAPKHGCSPRGELSAAAPARASRRRRCLRASAARVRSVRAPRRRALRTLPRHGRPAAGVEQARRRPAGRCDRRARARTRRRRR